MDTKPLDENLTIDRLSAIQQARTNRQLRRLRSGEYLLFQRLRDRYDRVIVTELDDQTAVAKVGGKIVYA